MFKTFHSPLPVYLHSHLSPTPPSHASYPVLVHYVSSATECTPVWGHLLEKWQSTLRASLKKNFDFFLPSKYQLTRAFHVVIGFDKLLIPHFPMEVLPLLGGMGRRWGGGEEGGTGIGM